MALLLLLAALFSGGSPAAFAGYEPTGAACFSIDLPAYGYTNRWIVWTASPLAIRPGFYAVTVSAVAGGYSVSLDGSPVWTCIASDPDVRERFSSLEGAAETRWQQVAIAAGNGTLLLLVE